MGKQKIDPWTDNNYYFTMNTAKDGITHKAYIKMQEADPSRVIFTEASMSTLVGVWLHRDFQMK